MFPRWPIRRSLRRWRARVIRMPGTQVRDEQTYLSFRQEVYVQGGAAFLIALDRYDFFVPCFFR
ncbi:hypothetical protein IXO89_17920 [Xanthomonas oryzae pv. oryzae]|nr:hypothetical protein IXO89_17920 [Xanthomonas oryzae pv. oryzae]